MSRKKKNGTHLNVIIRQDIYDAFCEYAERKGQTKTMALERIIQKVLDNNNDDTDVVTKIES
jgi:hypothetical protein